MKEVRITFKKRNAQDLISQEKFDDNGNVVGRYSDDEMEAWLREAEGMVVIDATAIICEQLATNAKDAVMLKVRSSRVNNNEREIRIAFERAVMMIAQSITRNKLSEFI